MIDVFKAPVHIGMSTNASPVRSAMLRQVTGIRTVRASHRLASVEAADIERPCHARGADLWVAHDPDDPAPVAKPNPAHALIKRAATQRSRPEGTSGIACSSDRFLK